LIKKTKDAKLQGVPKKLTSLEIRQILISMSSSPYSKRTGVESWVWHGVNLLKRLAFSQKRTFEPLLH
jgi:hypothetical protein